MPKIRIEPDTVAIFLTDQCTAECEMCCFGCSPRNTGIADRNVIKTIITQAANMPSIRTIGFSGGEVFLQYHLLLEMVEISAKLGFRTTCTTNGFWASDYDKALEKLIELKRCGLTKIGLSMDYFHQQYIDVQCLKNILEICKMIGIAVDIGSVVTKSTSDLSESLYKLKDSMVNVPHFRAACLPVGNAKRIPQEDFYFDENLLEKKEKCYELTYFSVYLNGDVYPCCSQAGVLEKLRLGNVYKDDMQELLKRYRANMHIRILKKYGFAWYLKIAHQENRKYILERKYVNKCDLCYNLLSDHSFMCVVEEYIQKEKEIIYQKYIDSKRDGASWK